MLFFCVPSVFYGFLLFAEHILAYAAEGAGEIFGKVLKFGAGGYTVFGVAECFVIHPTASVTYILFHNKIPPKNYILFNGLKPMGSQSEYNNVLKTSLFYRLKISRAVLAKGTDKVLGQWVALVDIAAYLANIAFFALSLGFGLYIVLVIGIGHGFFIGDNP